MPSSRRPPPGEGRRSRGEGRVAAGSTPGRRRRPAPDKRGGRRRTDQRAGARPPTKRRRRSDLGARILIAVPAAVLVVALIDVDHLAWAIFLIVLGVICLHELYRMLDAWKPVPLVGFGAVVGMVLAARYGSERVVLEVGVAVIPALIRGPAGTRATRARHALRRQHPFGSLVDRLRGGSCGAAAPASPRCGDPDRRAGRDIPRRHSRLSRRAAIWPPSARAQNLSGQDRRRPFLGFGRGDPDARLCGAPAEHLDDHAGTPWRSA